MEADFGLGNPSVTIPCYRGQICPASLAPVDEEFECENGIHAKRGATNGRAFTDLFGDDTYKSCLRCRPSGKTDHIIIYPTRRMPFLIDETGRSIFVFMMEYRFSGQRCPL